MNMIQRALLLILCALNLQVNQVCRLNSRIHFGQPLPIVIQDGKLLEPTDEQGNVEIKHGATITLSCKGAGVIQFPNSMHEVETANVNCRGGDSFGNSDLLSAPTSFSDFRCYSPPPYLSRRTDRLCFGNNSIFEVGYEVQNEFYAVYESCFNQYSMNVLYSKYTQKPYNALYQTRVERPYFQADDVYGTIPADKLFSPRGQTAAVTRLVGRMIDNYITVSEFLARGHLAAKTDFVFAFGERATFHYVNCAPQWSGFNGGNWNTLEVELRDHVHAAGYWTIIYTGTYGVTQLKNENGQRVDLYLYNDMNNNPLIPVPQYFYKVVYEPRRKCGIAFVGINNPYYTHGEAEDLFFCSDICRNNSEFSWLSWQPNDPHEGYTFCCTVEDFKRTIHHLPDFEVNCLLT